MVKYDIDEIAEGMVLGEPILAANGNLLVAQGFVLKQSQIELLKKMGIRSVMIHVEGTESVIPEHVITHSVKTELAGTVAHSKQSIQTVFQQNKNNNERITDIITKDKKTLNHLLASSSMFKVITRVIDDIITEPWTMLNITKIRERDEGFFGYVISVTVIALCIGHKYHLSPDEMRQLGLGALNFDIGMLAVPQEIINKTEELSADEKKVLDQHTIYGHMMLSDNSVIPPTSSIVALSHHEYQDGTGIPRGLKGENKPPLKNITREGIHRFAEIVAVADTYDMLVHGRPHYCKPQGPSNAIKLLIEMQGKKLNSDIVKTLIAMTPAYPVGTRVKISGSPIPNLIDCIAVISKVQTDHPFEPQILVFETKSHDRMKPVVLDFSKHKGFSILPID